MNEEHRRTELYDSREAMIEAIKAETTDDDTPTPYVAPSGDDWYDKQYELFTQEND